MGFWQRRKMRKHLHAMIHHARTLHHMREDVLAAPDLEGLNAAMAEAETARRGRDEEAMSEAAEALGQRIDALTPPCRLPGWRENFEVLVVALGVAMAFRAYFYQPFKIPTGSMQPTLYGIKSVAQPRPRPRDTMPLKVANWLATGDWYEEVRARDSGQVVALEGEDSKPGYVTLSIAGTRYYVPNDAMFQRRELHVRPDEMAGRYAAPGHVAIGHAVAGDVLWSGLVTAGDFVFVNRWAWNFRLPRRGEVMVFSTTGIQGLPQGTHYIKRMCGLPNETLAVHPPDLIIDGRAVYEPAAIARVARKERLPWEDTSYAGYQVIGNHSSDDPRALRTADDSIHLGPAEYFAMGDNTGNSRDSRYWGPVPEHNLLGPATLVYWPFTSPRWGRIH